MPEVYTTEQLIEILASERQACMSGQRLYLTIRGSGHPLIDQFIKSEGAQQFTAYQNFKAAVHRYQQEHQVSGLIWQEITLKGLTLRCPIVDEHLSAIESDVAVLKSVRASVLTFWYETTVGMDLYLSINNDKDYRSIQPSEVEGIVQRTEWATLWKWEKSDFLEVVLQLGWGKPEFASYKRSFPLSGSEYIHAVNPGCCPIG